MTATVGLQLVVLGAVSQAQSSLLVLAGSCLAFTVPWPIALLLLRKGSSWALVALLASSLLLAGVGGLTLGLAYLVQFGVGSFLVPYFLKRGWEWDKAILISVGASAGSGLVALGAYAYQEGKTPLALADHWARTEVARALEALRSAKLPAEVALQTEQLVEEVGKKLVELYPAITILSVAGMLLVTVWFLRRRAGAVLPPQSPFKGWKVAENLVWVLISSGAGALFLQGGWHRFALNIVLIVSAIYFLQGLAILSHFFNVKGVPPIFRVLGYFLVVASFPLRILATGVGIFDLWIDFRKPRKHKD
jgi:uncharacterized protein YybS (DUF2232 family)